MSRIDNNAALSLALGAALVLGLPASAMAQAAPSAPSRQDVFYRPAPEQKTWRTSDMIGEGVFNRAGERIGEVDDLIIDQSGRIAATVIGVGGFLGLGERLVAVSFTAVDLTREPNDNPRLVVDLTKDMLSAAPPYRPDIKRN